MSGFAGAVLGGVAGAVTASALARRANPGACRRCRGALRVKLGRNVVPCPLCQRGRPRPALALAANAGRVRRRAGPMKFLAIQGATARGRHATWNVWTVASRGGPGELLRSFVGPNARAEATAHRDRLAALAVLAAGEAPLFGAANPLTDHEAALAHAQAVATLRHGRSQRDPSRRAYMIGDANGRAHVAAQFTPAGLVQRRADALARATAAASPFRDPRGYRANPAGGIDRSRALLRRLKAQVARERRAGTAPAEAYTARALGLTPTFSILPSGEVVAARAKNPARFGVITEREEAIMRDGRALIRARGVAGARAFADARARSSRAFDPGFWREVGAFVRWYGKQQAAGALPGYMAANPYLAVVGLGAGNPPGRAEPLRPGERIIPVMTIGGEIRAYLVEVDGVAIGRIASMRRDYDSRWTFRNDDRGWFGGVGTRRRAIDALRELSSRGRNPPGRSRRAATIAEVARLAPKEFKAACAAVRRFHGAEPARVVVYRVDDGKPGVTRQVVAGLGPVPETHYLGTYDTSNKAGTHWVHKHPRGAEPLEVLDPKTGLTMKVGGKYRVTDWWHR